MLLKVSQMWWRGALKLATVLLTLPISIWVLPCFPEQGSPSSFPIPHLESVRFCLVAREYNGILKPNSWHWREAKRVTGHHQRHMLVKMLNSNLVAASEFSSSLLALQGAEEGVKKHGDETSRQMQPWGLLPVSSSQGSRFPQVSVIKNVGKTVVDLRRLKRRNKRSTGLWLDSYFFINYKIVLGIVRETLI